MKPTLTQSSVGAARAVAASLLLVVTAVFLAGCASAEAAVAPTPTLDPLVAAGKAVFVSECGSCHSTSPETVIVGPSLAGIAGRAARQVDGLDARAYLYSSILQPGDHLVEGFQDVMPANFGKKLTGEEIDSVVAYLLTLSD